MNARRWLLPAAVCCILGATALQAAAEPQHVMKKAPLKIGVDAALTGSFAAAYGAPFANGVVLAVRQINAAGGIDGHRLALTVEDNKGDPSTGALVMQKFAAAHIPVVVSNFTSVLKAQGPIATAQHMLVLNPAGSESTIALASPYIYTNRPYSTREFIVMSRYMKSKGAKNVAIVASDTANGRHGDEVLREQLKVNGISIAGDTQFYPPASTVDFSSILAKVRSQRPDSVFIYGTANDGGLFVKQAVAQGFDQPFYSYTGFGVQSVIDAAGSAASRVTWTVPVVWDPDSNPVQATFVRQWTKSFPDVVPSELSALHYDAVKCVLAPVIASALKHGGYSGPSLIKAIRSHTGPFNGCVTGQTKFTHGRDAIKPIAIDTAVNGKPKIIKIVAPADQEPKKK
jgi:branched-chain amino acid transport system substrate-binding protein